MSFTLKKLDIQNTPIQLTFQASLEGIRIGTDLSEGGFGNTRNLVLGFLLNNGKRLDAKIIEGHSFGFIIVATEKENARQAGFILEGDPASIGKQETVGYTLKPDEVAIRLNSGNIVGVIVVRELV